MADRKPGKFAKEKQFIKDKQIDELKTPPHSLEAEQSVLGGLLLDNETWDRVAEKTVAADFYSRSHRLIFETIAALIELGEPVDLITLSEALENDQKLDDAGGFVYLAEMMKNTPSAANITAYADIVRERAVTREMISVANELAEAGYDTQGRSSAELLDFAETKVFAIAEKRANKSEGPESLHAVLEKTVDRIEKLCSTDTGGVTGVPSGFADLDKMTAGLQKSDLIIVAARPSMGKCIVSGSQLVDPNTGAINSIDELVAAQHAAVISINNQFKRVVTQASEFVDDGLKPVFRVTTALGKSIDTTLTHPFLTGNGWQPLSEIKAGEQIAIPRSLPVFGQCQPVDHEIKAIAYMISDGTTRNATPVFTNTNAIIVNDFINAMTSFNGVSVKAIKAENRAQSYRVIAKSSVAQSLRMQFAELLNTGIKKAQLSGKILAETLSLRTSTVSMWRNAHALPMPETYTGLCDVLGAEFTRNTHSLFERGSTKVNPVKQLLLTHNLDNKLAYEKTLSKSVFTWNKSSITLLLNRMFACDGSVFIQNNDQVRVSYATASVTLAKQVQHLLLRFGIVAKLRKKLSNYANAQPQYEVEVQDKPSIMCFINEIGMIGKSQQCADALALLQQKRTKSNVDSLPLSVNKYVLSLKGNRSWSSIFSAANKLMPQGFNPHLQGASSRHLSRQRAQFYADLFNDEYLANLACSDVYWDKITAIEYQGYKQVYDLTVPDYHNFIAQDIFVHNTTFAMNLAEHAAMTQDKPALIFSLEMPADQIMMRMLASLGRIDQTKIRTGQLDDEDWARLSSTMGLLIENGKMFIDDAAGLTPTEVRSRARRIHRDHGGISLIMIDYLQLMRAPQFSDNRTLEIAEISRSLKALAKELQVPVVALSQLNRGLEQRSDKRPINSDLRESGSIEQDADLIMFIYRDEVYHDDSEFKGMAEIIIGKQRNGPIGRVPLTFQGKYSRFDNYAGPHVLEED